MERRRRLQRAKFKREGFQLDRIVRHKGRYIKVSGIRGQRWIAFRKEYLSNLPEMVTCHYCSLQNRGRLRPKHKMTLDHKNGRDGALLTDEDNIVVACFRCNQHKGSTPYDKYLVKIGVEKKGL